MAHWRDTGTLTPFQMLDIPPVWLLGFILLAALQVTFVPVQAEVPLVIRWIGAALVCAGMSLMIWAILAFRRHQTSVVPHQTPRRVITTGPFRFSRNPIYLGDVLMLVGVILWWGAWPSALLIPVFIGILTRRFIAPEEGRLKECFGPEYTAYAQKTRRWFGYQG